jgi:ATP-dependent RNA helicase DeaD
MTDSIAPDVFAGVAEPLRNSLIKRGFTKLTAIQSAVVEGATETRNLRLTSQTGSGKTIAIGLAVYPSLLAEEGAPSPGRAATPRVLLIVPTRELAQQLQSELDWLYENVSRARVEVVTGGTDVRAEQVRLRKKPRVLVGTPGRLLDHVRSGALDLSAVAEVVLDEADQMLDMGFKDELDELVGHLPSERRSHLVSATFPRGVQELAARFQSDALHLQGTALGTANADIEHVAHLVRGNERYAAVVNVLLANHKKRCLVFVQRRVDAAELAEMLVTDGFAAAPLSGDLPQAQRNRTLASFKNGLIDALIATDVAARGIHVDDIALVIHADPPKEPDVYTHRSGRTGRAGQQGRSVLIVTPGDRVRTERLLQRAKVKVEWEPVPSIKRIQTALQKQSRRQVHAALEGFTPDPSEVEYAQGLLSKYGPEAVISVLLRMSATKLPREPLPVEELAVRPSNDVGRQPPPGRGGPRRYDGPRSGPPSRPDYSDERSDFAARAPRGAKPPARPGKPNVVLPRRSANDGDARGASAGRRVQGAGRGDRDFASADAGNSGPRKKRPFDTAAGSRPVKKALKGKSRT